MATFETVYPTDTLFTKTSTSRSFDNVMTLANKENSTFRVSGSAKLYDDITAMLWYIAPPLLLVLGTFGNVMTVVVMRGMPASQSTACLYFYFTALAVSDQCTISVGLTFCWIDIGFSWPPSFFRYHLLCIVPKFLWNVSAISSAFILVAMTYQRVTSVLAPHRVGILCTLRRGKCIVAVIVICACAIHGQFLFTWSYWPDYRKCQYREKYMHVIELFEWLDLIFASILPFLLLVMGNSVLVWQVIKSNRVSKKLRVVADQQTSTGTEKVYSMTRTLIITSAVFLLLTLPICIFDVCLQMTYLNISDEEVIAMINLVKSVVIILWACAAATNYYLYFLSGKRFRDETARYLWCRNRNSAKYFGKAKGCDTKSETKE